jgi:hypothetical protein
MTIFTQPKKFSLSHIDLDKELGISKPDAPTKPKPKPALKRQPSLFIKGPIPLDWMKRANNLGGSTGIVATMLWFYVGLTGSKTIKLDSKIDDVTGLTRQTRQLILKRLEIHGLIKLFPQHGGYPRVTIL